MLKHDYQFQLEVLLKVATKALAVCYGCTVHISNSADRQNFRAVVFTRLVGIVLKIRVTIVTM
jgi:hypothetical protein